MADTHAERIGPYRILEILGEGGMAVVYLAEQTEPVKRQVALKVIKLGMDTKQVLARFESERQALALMNHAAIARVFDGGATEDGRPYFVMEYVDGVPITEFCDEQRSSTEERLQLFIRTRLDFGLGDGGCGQGRRNQEGAAKGNEGGADRHVVASLIGNGSRHE